MAGLCAVDECRSSDHDLVIGNLELGEDRIYRPVVMNEGGECSCCKLIIKRTRNTWRREDKLSAMKLGRSWQEAKRSITRGRQATHCQSQSTLRRIHRVLSLSAESVLRVRTHGLPPPSPDSDGKTQRPSKIPYCSFSLIGSQYNGEMHLIGLQFI